jgi:hypothetical protein
LLKNHGIEVEGYTTIRFVEDTDTVKNFIVPTSTMMEQGEGHVAGPGEYPLPDDMKDIYVRQVCPGIPNKPTKQEFWEFRIGDYSTGHCM